MADSNWMVENAEKVGIIGHLMFDVVAFMRGWIVPRDVHDRIIAENAMVRKALDDANARDREKLNRVEAALEDFVAPRRAGHAE